MVFKLGMTVCMTYIIILMLVSMTLTLMQGHSVSAEANKHKNSIELSRQAINMLGLILFHMTLT